MHASDLGLAASPGVTSVMRAPSRSWRHVVPRVAVSALAAVVIVATVAGAVLFDTDASIFARGFWPVRELLPAVIAFAAAAAVLILIRPARLIGWLLMACAALNATSVLCAGLFFLAFWEGWSGSRHLEVASAATGFIASALTLAILPQLFPDGVLRGWLWRTLLAVTVLLIVVAITLLALGPWSTTLMTGEFRTRVELVNPSWALSVVSRLTDLMIAIAVVTVLARLRRGPRQRRRQLAGFAAVYLTTQAFGYLSWLTVDPEAVVTNTLIVFIYPPAVVVAIAFAMLRFGLYDVRPVVHRAAVYTLLVVGLTAGFAAVYLVVLSGLSLQLAGGRYSWLIVVAALVVVLVADPVRRRLRVRLERRFLGERGEPLPVLARLDRMVATGRTDEQAVFTSVAETVMAAMRSPGAVVLLYRAGVLEQVGRPASSVKNRWYCRWCIVVNDSANCRSPPALLAKSTVGPTGNC